MIFIILLALVTTIVASSAALFSVIGIMQTYGGIWAILTLCMGVSLEIGKLAVASALYRMWNRYNLAFKTFMITLLLLLMGATSVGIFGYLTAGYQKDSLPLTQINQRLEADQKEIDRLVLRKQEIDAQIAKLPNNYVNSRQKLMASFEPELKVINPRIELLQKEIADFQDKKVTTETRIGPIIYIAKVLNRDPDESIFYFTFLLMCVFDPMAVGLTLATNMAIQQRKEDQLLPKADIVQLSPVANIPEPIAVPESLSKDDVIQIVKDNVNNEDLQSLQKRNEILAELRK